MYIQYPVLSGRLKTGNFRAVSSDFNVKSGEYEQQIDAINDVYDQIRAKIEGFIEKANKGFKVHFPEPSTMTQAGFNIDVDAPNNTQDAEQ